MATLTAPVPAPKIYTPESYRLTTYSDKEYVADYSWYLYSEMCYQKLIETGDWFIDCFSYGAVTLEPVNMTYSRDLDAKELYALVNTIIDMAKIDKLYRIQLLLGTYVECQGILWRVIYSPEYPIGYILSDLFYTPFDELSELSSDYLGVIDKMRFMLTQDAIQAARTASILRDNVSPDDWKRWYENVDWQPTLWHFYYATDAYKNYQSDIRNIIDGGI